MRQLYKKTQITTTQGCIFIGGLAEDYNGKAVHGLFITPRCDIKNQKVPTVHYLPIVDFDDWYEVEFDAIFRKRAYKEVLYKCKNLLKRANLSYAILEVMNDETILSNIQNTQISEKQKTLLLDKVNDYLKLKNNNIDNDLIAKYSNIKQSIIRDLTSGNIAGFYFIENWDTPTKYNVILLRDVRRVTLDIAERIVSGLEKNTLGDVDWKRNDLNENVEDGFYMPICIIESPFMEHIMQSFYHSFGRIGIEDIEILNMDDLNNHTH